jgi:hypothetical protein
MTLICHGRQKVTIRDYCFAPVQSGQNDFRKHLGASSHKQVGFTRTAKIALVVQYNAAEITTNFG